VSNEKKLRTINSALEREIEERKVSERKVKMLNKQLVDNNNELKAINEELDRFAFVASHDLQEPLRKIMLFSDKVLMKNNDEEIGGYLQKIVNSSQRMQNLIDDILRFSRHNVDSDDFTECDLNLLVEEAISELEIEIEKTGAQINIHPLPKVLVIPVLIRQLFYNLISNAIKFRKPDSAPVINIRSEKIDSSEINIPVLINNVDHYKISVEDNGIGFDSKYAEDIFVVFKRLHSYHEYEGTGVGLSICKKIIEKHKGGIMAESKKNKGSSFMIWLPEKQIL
jgi:light-regulated signal transduction histidine kinase (bacteriophytochrome)